MRAFVLALLAASGTAQAACPSEQDIKNMETSASSITLSKEQRIQRQAEIQAARRCRAGGSPTPDYSAVQAEQERAAARRAAAGVAPVAVTNCDSAGCWDTNGQRYNRAAGGNFVRQDGAFCTPVGNQLQCR